MEDMEDMEDKLFTSVNNDFDNQASVLSDFVNS